MRDVEVQPLFSRHPDGRPYTREAAVESALSELVALPLEELVERCRINRRDVEDYVPSEALVHLLRARQRDNRNTRFDHLYRVLLQRIARSMPRAERQHGTGVLVDSATSEANAAAMGRFDVLVALDRQGGSQLDFFEIHFDQAVARLRLSARRKPDRDARREVALETDDENGEPSLAVERAAGSLDLPEDPIFTDPMFRPHLLAAIETLSPEQKEVVTMIMQNIPIESSDPATRSISSLLGCDPRTVRNRRDRAVIRLKAILDSGSAS